MYLTISFLFFFSTSTYIKHDFFSHMRLQCGFHKKVYKIYESDNVRIKLRQKKM